MRRKIIPLAICGPLIALSTACTPRQVEQWIEWHNDSPAAAEAFAMKPEVQAQLHQAPRSSAPRTTTPRPSTPRTSAPSTGRSGVNWDAVARCESGGQWSHPPVTNRYGTFSGGLMIMNSAWRQYGGTQFAPYAGAATKAQQIIVAERIAAAVGAARAWQCPTPHV